MIRIRKVFVICAVLSILLCLSAVSASDINETTDMLSEELAGDENLEISGDEDDLNVVEEDNLEKNKASSVISTSSKTSSADVYVKDSNFNIQIVYKNGTGIANQSVSVKFNGKTTNLTTNDKGYVYFKLTEKGTFTLSYSFNADGYSPVSGSKKITVVANSKSKLAGSSYVAYAGYQNPYVVTLTTGGVKLPNKKVVFKINGKTYTKTTNSKGQATLNINLPKGSYTIKYSFKGVTNAKSTSGSAKITVKKGVPTRIVWQNAVTFRHKVSTPFILKYKDVRGKEIPSKTLVFKINGKTYTKKTDKNGLVTFYINLNKGVYKATVNSYNTKVLKSSTNKYTIKVKSNSLKNNGFWLFGADMKNVDLNKMAKYGVNNIFLNYYAIELHGKDEVASFATQAKSLGIKVHIWMQAFNNGKWISPVNKDGTYKYSYFNSVIKKAKEYAAIEGVAGIHFDYLRFPGTAYKHTNGVSAINYFTKTACEELHKQDSKLIVSAAIMPEPYSNKYYYGQDIPTISKYLDVLVPMVYKGNYNAGASWIKSVISTLVSQSNGAKVWTGLQGYASDSNVKKLSTSELINDADYAGFGGASGVMIFRYSLFNLFNFSSI